ncbi:glycine cleavage system T protein [Stachybotrys elegans]|uniref:Aminomethyltransferase n=1 Tax=Stachybotrys elegans TaxID=80388 RepID=A0A8K0SKE7_9HYPO|nr:glycine cleavage system T protein [Stachybotrys elegans]
MGDRRPRQAWLRHRHASSDAGAELNKTPLYDFHLASGAKLVPFAGYHMPISYASLSHAQSHHFTRNNASLFDVSHMVQHLFRGPAAAAFLETVTPSGFKDQPAMQGKLTTFLWPGTGGIVDDSIVTRLAEDEFYVVTNGACLDKDTKYFDEELGKFGGQVEWSRLDNSGLLALQGPKSAEILAGLVDVDLATLYFGSAVLANLKVSTGDTVPVLISRGGYTGEDGFELSFNAAMGAAPEMTALAAEALLTSAGQDRLQLAGLGARDSLRLEAGMCLYGHDLDDTTTPVEAALSWVIPKERREQGGFHGADVILAQLTPKSKGGTGVTRRRVGIVVKGAPAREGADIVKDGEVIGTVTSGSPSPTLGKNIAMGYVKDGLHKSGTELEVVVRGKARKGTVTKMPFVPTKYWKQLLP